MTNVGNYQIINDPHVNTRHYWCILECSEKVFNRSLLPLNNDNLPSPFFGGNYLIVLLDNIY